jgi:hypothetical protein
MKARSSILGWLLLALVAVVAQEALTVYPEGQGAQHAFWGGISLLLLYRVYRGGELARRIFLVIALFGAGLFLAAANLSVAAVDLARVGPLFVAYVVQASVMLLPAIREWTRQHGHAEPTPVAVG